MLEEGVTEKFNPGKNPTYYHLYLYLGECGVTSIHIWQFVNEPASISNITISNPGLVGYIWPLLKIGFIPPIRTQILQGPVYFNQTFLRLHTGLR